MGGAAIFDLDRTLLAGGSWPAYSRALRDHGLLEGREPPGFDAAFAFFEAFGESYLTMQLSRRTVRHSSGWPLSKVQDAARAATEVILAELQPYVRSLLGSHRRQGHPLLLATTTPEPLVQPFADALGFDAVVATRYRARDGAYDGTIEGEFVWNRGKLRAVQGWARAEGVDLASSHAYSDSFFDAPLLAAVGHATAVNPDPRLLALAMLRGWPVRWLNKPAGVPTLLGVEVGELLRPLANPLLAPNARFAWQDIDHIPQRGPALVVADQRSPYDVAAVAAALARRGRVGRFLVRPELLRAPLVGAVLRALGSIPTDSTLLTRADLDVDPGWDAAGDARAVAGDALGAGEVVVALAPRPDPDELLDPDPMIDAVAALAAETKAPLIPLGSRGTEQVWPEAARLPRLSLGDRPLVTVTAGPPLDLTRDVDLDARRVRAALAELAAGGTSSR